MGGGGGGKKRVGGEREKEESQNCGCTFRLQEATRSNNRQTDRQTDLVGLGSSFSCGGRRREGECSRSPGQGWPPSYACTTTCRGNRGIAYM